MTELVLAAGRDEAAWRAALSNLASADAYDDPAYARVTAERVEHGAAWLVMYQGAEGTAFNVLALRPLERLPLAMNVLGGAAAGMCDALTPYGYGGPRFEPAAGAADALRTHFAALLERFCRERGVVSEFVRFHPLKDPAASGLYKIEQRGRVWLLDVQATPDELLQRCSSACRRAVRRAEAAGLAVRAIDPAQHIERFAALYRRTMQRAGARQFYLFEDDYFHGLLGLDERLVLLQAETDGAAAAMALFLRGASTLHYHLGASNERFLELRPNNLLFYRAALLARAAGLQRLHLGGGMGNRRLYDPVDDSDGLDRFKASFGTKALPFTIGKRIWDQGAFDRLCAAAPAGDPAFFPPYRRSAHDNG